MQLAPARNRPSRIPGILLDKEINIEANAAPAKHVLDEVVGRRIMKVHNLETMVNGVQVHNLVRLRTIKTHSVLLQLRAMIDSSFLVAWTTTTQRNRNGASTIPQIS